MKRLLVSALFLTSVAVPLSGQGGRGARAVPAAGPPAPQLAFHIEEDFFKLPENIWPSEAVGVLTLGEAAVRLGVSRSQLEAMIAAGKIEALPTGFTQTIPSREVERLY